MYKIIKFENEPNYIKDFLELPLKLYSKKTLVQNMKDEEKILKETHSLSKYFSILKYLCYDDKNQVIARAIVTLYDNKEEAYIGFFEAYNDKNAVKELFSKIEKELKNLHITKIIGPVDSSFWIKYRMKIDSYNEEIYIGEPYNKDYYKELFEDNNFCIYKKWTSNIYKISNSNYNPKKYEDRYNEFSAKGYKIISPKNKEEFNDSFKIACKLIMELYKDFPLFNNISEKDYYKYFYFYSSISNYKFLKIAYYNNEPVGFFIGIPNYKNLLYGKLTLIKKIRILFIKKYSKSIVAQYIGVKPEHKGLGKAIIYTILQEVRKCQGKIIGALIEDGKETGQYFDDAIVDKCKYVLFKKEIGE